MKHSPRRGKFLAVILIGLALLAIFVLAFNVKRKGKDVPQPVPMPSQPPTKEPDPSEPFRPSRSRSVMVYQIQFGENMFLFC